MVEILPELCIGTLRALGWVEELEHLPSGRRVAAESIKSGYATGGVTCPETTLGVYGAPGEGQIEERASNALYDSCIPAGIEFPEFIRCYHGSEIYITYKVPVPLDYLMTVVFYGGLEMGELETENVNSDVSEIATVTLFCKGNVHWGIVVG